MLSIIYFAILLKLKGQIGCTFQRERVESIYYRRTLGTDLLDIYLSIYITQFIYNRNVSFIG